MGFLFPKAIRRFFTKPQQVKRRHYSIVSFFGKVGFITKGFIYAFIGALTCQSAFTSMVQNESPQGVFILLGSAPNGASHIYLITLFAGIVIYATWRFWEGITGQGYDRKYSKRKNFFKYRLSPIASGIVYSAYGVYIIVLFIQDRKAVRGQSVRNEDNSCFPVCWKETTIGSIALGVLAVAFTIATITQLIPAITGNFQNELNHTRFTKNSFGKIIKYPFFIAGHVGFLSRAVLFFLVCFLFWQVLFTNNVFLDPKYATVSQAINSIRKYTWGKAALAILGIGLALYGFFAALCSYFKIFPTPPPSANTTIPNDGGGMQIVQSLNSG